MSTFRYARALLVGLLCATSPSLAASSIGEESAAPPRPRDIPARRLVLEHAVSAGLNPNGAEYRTRLGYRLRLGQSDEPLWRNTFLSLGGQVRLSPTYAAVGPVVEWQPIAVFSFRALVEAIRFFGTLDQFQSFNSPLATYSDEIRRQPIASPYATSGLRAMLQPTLQARVGPVLVQSVTSLDYRDMRLRDGDSVWYEVGPDSLLSDRGWAVTEEFNLLYRTGPLTLGTSFRYFLPLYSPEHFQPGEQASPALNANMRLGLLATYTFSEGGHPLFHHPTVLVRTQWHLSHPYRAGTKVQARPFVGLGLSFQQDFLP